MFGATFNVDHVDLAELVAEARHGEDRRQFDGAFVKGQTPHDDEASAPSSAALPEAVRLRIEADTDAELEKRVRLELAAGTIVGRDLQRQWRRDVTKRFTAKYLNSTLADEDDGDDDGADGAESARVGHWEQYTKGVGSKLLQAMGWEAGKGLGLLLVRLRADVVVGRALSGGGCCRRAGPSRLALQPVSGATANRWPRTRTTDSVTRSDAGAPATTPMTTTEAQRGGGDAKRKPTCLIF